MNPARVLAITLVLIAALSLAVLAGCGSKESGGGSSTTGSTSGSSTGSSTGAVESTATPPPAPTTPSLALGEKVFKQRCALCHGPGGHGDGPAAAALKPHPRNFHDTAYMKSRTDDQLLLTIHNGKGPMPAWKSILTEVEMRSALLYVRQFASSP